MVQFSDFDMNCKFYRDFGDTLMVADSNGLGLMTYVLLIVYMQKQ